MIPASSSPDHHRLSVAPMMDWTDRHCRYFLRQLSSQVLLYTEMVTTGAVLHGNRERLLGFHPEERPLVLQLGGDHPGSLAESASIAEALGYDEVNLNVGCPSDRVQGGSFGACLMRRPERVAECVAAMRARVRIPVTVKHRIGVDELDSYQDLVRFVCTVASAGCETFIVHARKAWLKGLSPRENREIPPLRYADVHRLKQDLSHLRIELNGGIRSLDEVEAQLHQVDGVMVGRAAYEDPYLLATADRRVFGIQHAPIRSRVEVVERLLPYAEVLLSQGEPLKRLSRHLLGLFQGQRGARLWRRTLSERAFLPGAGVEVLTEALKVVLAAQDAPPPLTHPGDLGTSGRRQLEPTSRSL